MATYTFNTDTYQKQIAALSDSSQIIKDGTKLTGNVQIAVAKWTAKATYANGDVITIPIVRLPKGVRILPHLCGCLRTAGGTYNWGITECNDLVALLTGDQTAGSGTPSILSDDEALTTAPCVVQAEFTLGASLPASFVAQFYIAYASPA